MEMAAFQQCFHKVGSLPDAMKVFMLEEEVRKRQLPRKCPFVALCIDFVYLYQNTMINSFWGFIF